MLDAVDRHYLQKGHSLEILDRQHSEIKCKRQNLRRAIVEGLGMDQIVACSKDLIDTTLTHFKSEESAMEASGYVGLGVHKLLHDEMAASLKAIWIDLGHRKISDAMELMNFFDVRLAYHLDCEDGAFGRELRDAN